MLGAIAGDIIGSRYEFANYKGKDFQPLFHPRASFTDDTVCTVAVADALTSGLVPTTTLRVWCHRYWSNGGWGQRFAFWLSGDDPAPYGSFGNGAAMRVSPAGLLARSETEALTCALQADSFEDAMRNAISIGGDSDTTAAIAGGVAEARFGIPDAITAATWKYLPADMQVVLEALYQRASPCRQIPSRSNSGR